MRLSLKWLSDYIKIEVIPKRFSEDMTMSGSKVETIEQLGQDIHNVVVGKILSVEPHPDADKLVVCQVDVGQAAALQIVTGAKNVSAGDMVPVALDGASLPGGKEIHAGQLRGVASQGMMCSLGELGLTVHDFPYAIEDGIFLLEEPCKPGDDICKALGLDDFAIEFEITPNRQDCLSVLGLARETSATYQIPFAMPQTDVQGGGADVSSFLHVQVEEPALCPRYMAKTVTNVKIGPSPRWMRERLRASGVRPINNIVDITNFVMLEYGQPMHAFDYRLLEGQGITVRCAREGEEIVTLDGVRRSLKPSMLVIADEVKPVAVAGIMGGEYSGIVDDTTTVVFESACFDGPSVRTTSRALGLRTESSGCFEKGLDPQNCLPALLRACHLVEQLGAGTVGDGMIDVRNFDDTPREIPFDPAWINQFLETNISEETMRKILLSLEFKIEDGKIIVPSWRQDVEHKADIAEEIARMYGYDKIPSTLMNGAVTVGGLTPAQEFEEKIAAALVAQGMNEIVTYSFISPKYYDKIGLPPDAVRRNSVVIRNPLGEDTSVMRTTALPSMLEVLARNYKNRNKAASLFELATVYMPQQTETTPATEKRMVMLGSYGTTDFFGFKGILESVLSYLGIQDFEFQAVPALSYHPGRCAYIKKGNVLLGVMGEIHPKVLRNYGIDTPVLAAELDFAALLAGAETQVQFKPLPRFPAVTRDLALVCDESVPVAQLELRIRRGAGALLEELRLFDVYRGEQLPSGKKSVAYALVLRAEDRTLTDEETDAVMQEILKNMQEIGAALRI